MSYSSKDQLLRLLLESATFIAYLLFGVTMNLVPSYNLGRPGSIPSPLRKLALNIYCVAHTSPRPGGE